METVQEAADGNEAIDLVREVLENPATSQTIDAVIVDYVLLSINGPVVSSTIRALGYKGIIVGVIGYYLPVDVKTFMTRGADKVITKPVDVSHLIAIIQGEIGCASLPYNTSVLHMTALLVYSCLCF